MTAARAAKRRKSVAAPTDETITQLHVSISSVDEDARNLECYQEEQRKDICQLYDTAASQMTTATEQGQTPRELQSTVTTQQQQIQTLMDTVYGRSVTPVNGKGIFRGHSQLTVISL